MQSSSLLLTSDLCGSWSAGEESFSRRRVESNRQTSVEKQQKNNRKSGKSIENRTRRRVDVGDNHCHTGLRLQNPSLFSVHKIHQNTSKYIKTHQNTSLFTVTRTSFFNTNPPFFHSFPRFNRIPSFYLRELSCHWWPKHSVTTLSMHT